MSDVIRGLLKQQQSQWVPSTLPNHSISQLERDLESHRGPYSLDANGNRVEAPPIQLPDVVVEGAPQMPAGSDRQFSGSGMGRSLFDQKPAPPVIQERPQSPSDWYYPPSRSAIRKSRLGETTKT